MHWEALRRINTFPNSHLRHVLGNPNSLRLGRAAVRGSDWPSDMPGLQTSAVRIARTIEQASGGRIKVEVFPAGAFVRAFETFEAVGDGIADMYHSFEGSSRANRRR